MSQTTVDLEERMSRLASKLARFIVNGIEKIDCDNLLQLREFVDKRYGAIEAELDRIASRDATPERFAEICELMRKAIMLSMCNGDVLCDFSLCLAKGWRLLKELPKTVRVKNPTLKDFYLTQKEKSCVMRELKGLAETMDGLSCRYGLNKDDIEWVFALEPISIPDNGIVPSIENLIFRSDGQGRFVFFSRFFDIQGRFAEQTASLIYDADAKVLAAAKRDEWLSQEFLENWFLNQLRLLVSGKSVPGRKTAESARKAMVPKIGHEDRIGAKGKRQRGKSTWTHLGTILEGAVRIEPDGQIVTFGRVGSYKITAAESWAVLDRIFNWLLNNGARTDFRFGRKDGILLNTQKARPVKRRDGVFVEVKGGMSLPQAVFDKVKNGNEVVRARLKAEVFEK